MKKKSIMPKLLMGGATIVIVVLVVMGVQGEWFQGAVYNVFGGGDSQWSWSNWSWSDTTKVVKDKSEVVSGLEEEEEGDPVTVRLESTSPIVHYYGSQFTEENSVVYAFTVTNNIDDNIGFLEVDYNISGTCTGTTTTTSRGFYLDGFPDSDVYLGSDNDHDGIITYSDIFRAVDDDNSVPSLEKIEPGQSKTFLLKINSLRCVTGDSVTVGLDKLEFRNSLNLNEHYIVDISNMDVKTTTFHTD